jgi:hypothetical protein
LTAAGTGAAALPLLPPAVHARFAAYEEGALRAAEHRGFLFARLLEEGEGDELRWLLATVERGELAAWYAAHAGAALSRRSRLFWAAVLDVDAPSPRPLARELWPLA